MRFREGDIVRISKDSTLYGSDDWNPKNIEGKITNLNSGNPTYIISVKWDNGYNCVFREIDLKLVKRD